MQHSTAYLDVSITDPSADWSYVSEGGASIVFSYVGLSNSTFNGTVLRLRKSPRHGPDHAHPLPFPFVGQEEPDDPSIAFQDTIISKLVQKAHLPRLQTVKVSPGWLQAMSAAAEARRPVERTAKDGIDTSKTKGVLATDLVGGKGWAVEIKPKWGFLPSTTYLSSATLPLKARHCRFCMHAHLKNKNNTSMEGGYCPLDLYSGNETRVKRAVSRLWQTWIGTQGKVNNLRVFVDGEIINPDDVISYNRLAAHFPSAPSTALPESMPPQFVEALLPLLMDTPLLSTICRLQRTLDSLDIEGLSQLWSRYHSGVPLGQDTPNPSLVEWQEFMSTFQSTGTPIDGEKPLRYYILAYLLSATFKDCSIILRLGREGADGAGRVGNTITVIDLDPKSVDRLSKWEELDQEIVANFAEVAAERAACNDSTTRVEYI